MEETAVKVTVIAVAALVNAAALLALATTPAGIIARGELRDWLRATARRLLGPEE